MDQLLLSGFSRLRVQPRNLLPAGMEITPYNHHCEDSFLPSVFGPQIKTTGSNRVFALIQSTHRALCDVWVSSPPNCVTDHRHAPNPLDYSDSVIKRLVWWRKY